MQDHKLKRFKLLQVGGKSKYVYLMEKNVIKKAYDMTNKDQKFRFNKEIEIMQHLENCPFVPKLLHPFSFYWDRINFFF